MSTTRRMNLKQNNKYRRKNGLYGKCRYCEKDVKPPRRTFCSNVCVHEWRIRSDIKYMREKIYERDLGICALCKIDTRYTKIEIENISRDVRNGKKEAVLDGFLTSLRITKKESVKSLWHADHIIPVKDGGGLCGVENIRTLCISCHKAVTKSSRSKKP